MNNRKRPALSTVIDRETNRVTITEHHHIGIRERRHLMGDKHHRATFRYRMLQCRGRLAAKSIISVFRLPERIINAPEIRIGMIPPLMIKRMPLRPTDKLSCSAVHFIITL